MPRTSQYAKVVWMPCAIQKAVPEWTENFSEAWLIRNEERIRDAMLNAGWETIADLLAEDGIAIAAD